MEPERKSVRVLIGASFLAFDSSVQVKGMKFFLQKLASTAFLRHPVWAILVKNWSTSYIFFGLYFVLAHCVLNFWAVALLQHRFCINDAKSISDREELIKFGMERKKNRIITKWRDNQRIDRPCLVWPYLHKQSAVIINRTTSPNY